MTVENTTNKKRFLGDGATDEVTFNFRALSISDIKVYVYPEDLDFDDLEDYLLTGGGVDYSIELEADGEGGTITFTVAPTTDEIGLIINELGLTQTADLPTEGNFNEGAVETALDRMVMQNIQQQEQINRGVSLRVEDPLAVQGFLGFFIAAVEAADRAGQVVVFNATGDGMEGADLADLSGSLDVVLTNVMTGDYLKFDGTNWVNVVNPVGTLGAQNSNNVTITGGSITGITDLAIADGGTGASTAAAAFTALKQAASDTATGVVELLTEAEIRTGTDTTRAPTAAGLKAAFGMSSYYATSQQTITAAGPLTIAHGLGRQPILYPCFLQCTSAEHGYSIADEIPVGPTDTSGAANGIGLSLVPDATNLNIRFGDAATTFLTLHKTTGAPVSLTNASWRLVVRYWG